DGGRLQIQTVGIALSTLDNSKSVFIGELQPSIGELVEGNSVIYPGAFGPVKADLRVRNSLAAFESDVILRETVNPADWGFDPQDCKLEVWSQIFQMPENNTSFEKIEGRQSADMDRQIKFGSMEFGRGSAFNLAPGGGE